MALVSHLASGEQPIKENPTVLDTTQGICKTHTTLKHPHTSVGPPNVVAKIDDEHRYGVG